MPEANQNTRKQPSQTEESPPLPAASSLTQIFGLGTALISYSRAQALEDGVLVDVSETAKEAGFRLPVAVTAALWADINDIPEGSGQDTTGRLWDVLWMGVNAIRRAVATNPEIDTVRYQLILSLPEDPPGQEVLYTIKSVVGPGDDLAPVITLMQPNED